MLFEEVEFDCYGILILLLSSHKKISHLRDFKNIRAFVHVFLTVIFLPLIKKKQICTIILTVKFII